MRRPKAPTALPVKKGVRSANSPCLDRQTHTQMSEFSSFFKLKPCSERQSWHKRKSCVGHPPRHVLVIMHHVFHIDRDPWIPVLRNYEISSFLVTVVLSVCRRAYNRTYISTCGPLLST